MGQQSKSAYDYLILFFCVIYYVMTNAVSVIVGSEGSRLGGIILFTPFVIFLLLYLIQKKGKVRIRLSSFHTYFIVFISYCFLNCFLFATYKNNALSRTIELFETALVVMAIYTAFDERENVVEELLQVIMLGGFLLVIVYILSYGWTYIIYALQNADRITSDTVNANTLGMSAAYSCVIFVYFVSLKKVRIWWIPLAVFAFVIIFASQSRKAFLILILGLLGLFVLNNVKEKNILKTFVRIVFTIAAIFVVVWFLEYINAISGILERMQGLINLYQGFGVVDKSAQRRSRFLEVGIQLFASHPIGGIGIDCARYYTTSLYGYNYHLHNNYIELLADGGILGIAAYYWLYVKILIGMIKEKKFENKEFNICFVLIIVRLIMDYGFYSYKGKNTYFFLMLFYMCYKKYIINKNITIKETNIINDYRPFEVYNRF